MPTIVSHGRTFDARPDRIDFRDLPYRSPLISLPPQYPKPQHVESYLPRYCEDGMILDQGKEGACTGFGLAACINYLFWERQVSSGETTKIAKLSPRMLYQMARLYDEWPGEDYEGSSCRGAMKGWHRHGVCTDAFWPYGAKGAGFVQPHEGWDEDAARRPLGAYYRVAKESLVEVQAAIHEVHAVYASATVHEGWQLKQSSELPLIDTERKAELGGHAFALVGYTENGFIIQNSWGPGWGYNGFAVLTYADWLANAMDAWVAVLGAPIAVKRTAVAMSSIGLQNLATRPAGQTVTLARGSVTFTYKNKEVMPWPEDEAYRHTIILADDGAPQHRLLTAANGVHNLQIVALEGSRRWLQNAGSKKLAIYAHGGLNEEAGAIARVRVLAPYFKANGILPLFISWQTGFLQNLVALLEAESGKQKHAERAGGLSDEVWDRTLELFARSMLVRPLWTQMRQNARAAAEPHGGLMLLADHLAALRKAMPELEIYLVGHSAGAVLLGYLLERLGDRKLEINSLILYAPACTMGFAARYYGRALKSNLLDRKMLHIEILSDALEQADSVGPYGKSLLYLISRALEGVHKMPLLGLDTAWQTSASSKDLFNQSKRPDIERWLELYQGGPDPAVQSREKIDDGVGLISSSHNSFDSDIAILTRTLERMAGSTLRYQVENLRGF